MARDMDRNHLGQQIEGSIDELHVLFDEIGVATQERETRESELFAALSDALNRYVRHVATEKKDLVDEAKTIIVAIRQMETSLEDQRGREVGHEELKVTFPLMRCLQMLREKHGHVARLHKERYEQVMKLAEALESYSSHLEPTFVKIALPPLGPNRSIPLTFDLSPSYVARLDSELTRVFDEYSRRLKAVRALGEHIVQLWADLGVPQNQQDAAVTEHYQDAPEQLGLHEEDIERLSSKRDKLAEEKKNREKRLQTLRAAVEDLWEKLGVNFEETQAFLKENKGCGIRQINEFEEELERLNELKRQNLQYFVEDARLTLQELWDSLYFSEDEMLEFTPAFSEAYSDALLEAHEREIKRLSELKEERAPTLAAVAKYKGLIKDRDELIASSQDSSRLMLRGQKGEKRDPGKLLREEKMRKRIAKELPRATVEARKVLERWEEERGQPFLVYGERFLDELEAEEEAAAAAAATTTTKRPARTRTPAPAPQGPAVKMPGSAHARAMSSNSNSSLVSNVNANSNSNSNAPLPTLKSVSSRAMLKTPSAHEASTKTVFSQSYQVVPSQAAFRVGGRDAGSPSKQSQSARRVPLSSLKNETTLGGAPMRAPPPKMRSIMKNAIAPEDVYDERSWNLQSVRSDPNSNSNSNSRGPSIRMLPPVSPLQRQTSSTSYSTTVCGSENWETYEAHSEPEEDVSEEYCSKPKVARGKRAWPEGHRDVPPGSPAKRVKGVRPVGVESWGGG